jgi:hypothetical protein
MSQALPRSARRVMAPVAAAAAAVSLLASAGSAQANYHYTQQGAEKIARDFVVKHYAVDPANVGASCRPQGTRQADSRFKYHRWVCTWTDAGSNTYGRVLIVGSDASSGSYYWQPLP